MLTPSPGAAVMPPACTSTRPVSDRELAGVDQLSRSRQAIESVGHWRVKKQHRAGAVDLSLTDSPPAMSPSSESMKGSYW
jgi:hypothetical protein